MPLAEVSKVTFTSALVRISDGCCVMTGEGCGCSCGNSQKQPQRTSARAVAAAAAWIMVCFFIWDSELNFDIIAERMIHFQNKHGVSVDIEIRIAFGLSADGVFPSGILDSDHVIQ